MHLMRKLVKQFIVLSPFDFAELENIIFAILLTTKLLVSYGFQLLRYKMYIT